MNQSASSIGCGRGARFVHNLSEEWRESVIPLSMPNKKQHNGLVILTRLVNRMELNPNADVLGVKIKVTFNHKCHVVIYGRLWFDFQAHEERFIL